MPNTIDIFTATVTTTNSNKLTSFVLSIVISILYPASLYIWPNALTSDRHNPNTIKRNFISVLGISIISFNLLVIYLQWQDDSGNQFQRDSLFQYVNWKTYDTCWNFFLHSLLYPILHVTILFTGPIYLGLKNFKRIYISGFKWNSFSFVMQIFFHWLKQLADIAVIRNLLVAPLSEEFIFRGILLSILVPFWSKIAAIAISSILFGLMHTHHFWRSYYQSKLFNKREAISNLFQCIYTALFGAYASLTYLASGHLVTPILVHSFCNLNGLPDFQQIATNPAHLCLTIIGFIVWLSLLSRCLIDAALL